MRVGGKRGLEFCSSCERVVDRRTRDNVDRVWIRSPPEFYPSPPLSPSAGNGKSLIRGVGPGAGGVGESRPRGTGR